MEKCENCKKKTTTRWTEERWIAGHLKSVCHDCAKEVQNGTGRKPQGDQIKLHCSVRVRPKDKKKIIKDYGGVQAFLDEMIAKSFAS